MFSSYQLARQQAAYCKLSDPGFLQIQGQDRSAFLQRQTTNNLEALRPGLVQLNVLTSPSARILDVFCLFQDNEAIGVITLPGFGAATAAFLQSRIFFMDKVSVQNASAEFVQLELIGAQAAAMLEQLGLHLPESEQQLAQESFAGSLLRFWRTSGALGLGYRLLVPVAIWQTLCMAFEQVGVTELAPETYDVLRIEAGIPAARYELTEAYTPLETGLKMAVSDRKGCYTGQEIIARQITYDKITQQLCGLKLAAPVHPGVHLWADGRQIGTVTSSAQSPRFGPIALAIVKRPYDQIGGILQAGEQAGDKLQARLVALPFELD